MDLKKTYINSFEKVIVILSILLLVFGNSTLQNTSLGVFGSNLAFIPLSLLMFYQTFKFLSTGRANVYILGYMTLIITSSLVGAVLFLNSFSTIDFLKFFIIYLVFLTPLFVNLGLKIYGYVFLLVFLCMSSLSFIPGISENELFHGNENLNMRFRGLYSEASHFAATFAALTFIVLIYFRKSLTIFVFISIISFYVLFFVVYSKGFFISIFIAILVMILINLRLSLKKIIIVFLSLLVFTLLFFVFVAPNLMFYFETQAITSFSTRALGILAGFYSLLHYPMGVGFLGYKENLVGIYTHIRDWEFIYFFDFSEIDSYISGKSNYLSTKNFFSDWFVIFGLPGVLLISFFLKRVWVNIHNDFLLSFSFIFLLTMLFTFVNGIGLYAITFLLGVIVSHAKE